MALEGETIQTGSRVIDIAPIEVAAAADLSIAASITCEPACDLRGQLVELRDSAGEVVGNAEIIAFEDGTNLAEEIVVKAPPQAGAFAWTAVLPAFASDGTSYPEASSEFEITVTPHPVHMTVWGVPYSVNSGDCVRFRVGIKCGAGCQLASTPVAIDDGEGNELAVAASGAEPQEGTKSLYVAEFEIDVPSEPGLYNWQATVPEADDKISHAAGVAKFSVRVMPQPEFVVTVEVTSQETGEAMAGARVVMHPYRTQTDENGIAKINAAKGDYTIFVSKAKHDPMSSKVSLNEDFATEVALVREEDDFNPDDNY